MAFLRHADPNAAMEALSVEAQWNQTISQLGIEPVYPPQEDVAVGDLFAVVENASAEDMLAGRVASAKPFISRAVKLAHINMSDRLQRAYADMPVFPADLQDAPGAKQPLAAADAPSLKDVWTNPKRATLPEAAFPGISIRFNASGGVGGNSLWSRLGFSDSRSSEQTVDLRSVETYGLPSMDAAEILDIFCKSPGTAATCTEDTARKHLSYVFSPVLITELNMNTNKMFHMYNVKIIMISRVYYARRIIERSGFDVASAGAIDAGLRSASTTSAAAPSDGGKLAADTAVGNRLADLSRRLATVEQGGAANYSVQNGNHVVLDQTFVRPVAFGYRSVAHDFPKSVADDE